MDGFTTNNGQFYASVVASIVSCGPVIVDYFADMILIIPKSSFEQFTPRRETFIALIFMDIILLAYILPSNDLNALPGIIGTRDSLFNCA